MRQVISALAATSLSIGSALAADGNLGLSPQEFVTRINAAIVEGKGQPGFSELGRCQDGICEWRVYGGVVVGEIAAIDSSAPINAITFRIGPSNDMNGVFFAALGVSMSVLASEASTSEQRGAAMMDVVRTITTRDVVVSKTFGDVTWTVDAVPGVGIIGTIR